MSWLSWTRIAAPRDPLARAGRYRRRSRRLDRLVEEMLGALDLSALEAVAERHRERRNTPHRRKYLDARTWLRRHLVHAEALGLLEGPPRRVLDLGTGNGYFPHVLTHLGHQAVALDRPARPFFGDMVSLLGVDCRPHRIRAFEPLPDLGVRFDWVTAFNSDFHAPFGRAPWSAAEWRFFLEDLARHALLEDGQVFVKLNPLRRRGGHDTAPLLALLHETGARVELPFFHFADTAPLRATPASAAG